MTQRPALLALTLGATLCLGLLTACGKQDAATTPGAQAPSLAAAQDPAALAKAAEDKRVAALPKADAATPVDAYRAIDSGNQLMYLFYAVSGMPPDMEQIAERLSQDYRATNDSFKRQDILKVLAPRVQSEIAAAGGHRYVIWEADNDVVDHYDFERKRFPVKPPFWKGESNFYYNDNAFYKISFNGDERVRGIPVADEAAARAIEDKVGKYGALRLRVYAFVQDADLNSKTLRSQPVKLELLDKQGKVLATTAL
ncbi:hypothetical protein [Roseateles sp.]|uniref:hypothetical protein n=1 Tax=Roseateles sp. TaxID=1971397 RepID=UPI0031E1BB95